MSIKFCSSDHLLWSISEVLNNKVEETAKSVMEAQEESHKLAPSEDEDILDVSLIFHLDLYSSTTLHILKGFHVQQQPIRTRLGSQLFKFKSERDEQTSIGDLKKALKRKWCVHLYQNLEGC